MNKLFPFLLLLTFAGCSGSYIKVDVINDVYSSSMYGLNPERNNYVNIELSDTLQFSWQNEVYGSFAFNSVVGYDSLIFVNDLSGKIFCYNVYSGKKKGQLKFRGSIYNTPLIHKYNLVFAVSEYNQAGSFIYSYNFTRGTERFKFPIKGKILVEGLLVKDNYFFLTESGKIILLDQAGKLVDERETELFTHSNPVMKSDYIYWGTDRGTVLRYSNNESKNIDRLQLSSFPLNNGIIHKSDYYLTDNNGVLYCLDLNTFNLKWQINLGHKILASPVHDGTTLWIFAKDGAVISINSEKGEVIKKTNLKAYFNAPPLVMKNVIIAPDFWGNLFLLNKEDLKVLQKISYETRMKLTPVYFKNHVIIGMDSGILHVYKAN